MKTSNWKAAGVLFGAALALGVGAQLHADQRAQLTCKGRMGDVEATLSGVRTYKAHSAEDGYVAFTGRVTAGGIEGRMTYEGYTRTAPFPGVITTSDGP